MRGIHLANRVLLLVLLLALLAPLLAGCTVPAERGTTSSGTPSQPHESSNGSGGGSGGGNGFAMQQGTAHGSTYGVDVDVAWKACDAGFCAHATATNQNPEAVSVSSICVSPWFERMARDGASVQPHEPRAVCQAYGRKDFAPGATMEANLTWDGRLWDSGEGEPAPRGGYTWGIVFWFEDRQGGQRFEAVADVHLVVGET